MAKSISLCDTHRTPYANAVLTAYKLADGTTQIKFKAGKNSSPEYFEVKTNSRGYLCDTNGNIYSVGIFVEEDALIKCLLPDGNITTWQVCVDDDTPINDGKLLGLRTPTSEDDDLEEKWSANSPNDHVLNYNELTNRPAINEWMEVEQLVTMEDDTTDSIVIDKYAKSVIIQADPGIHPEGWEYADGAWNCQYHEKRNAAWRIALIPAQGRVAQTVCVRNNTLWRLALTDQQGNIMSVLDPWDGAENGKMLVQIGDKFREVPNEHLGSAHSTIFDANVDGDNSALNPLVINDYTPDVLDVFIQADYSGEKKELYLQSQVSKSRRILLWIRNAYTADPTQTDGIMLMNVSGGQAAPIGFANNFSTIQLLVIGDRSNPASNAVFKVSDTMDATTAANRATAINRQTPQKLLAQTTVLTGNVDGNLTFDCEAFTNKLVYCHIYNSASVDKSALFRISPNQLFVPLLANRYTDFIIAKIGDTMKLVWPQASETNDKYLKIGEVQSGEIEHGTAYFIEVKRTSVTQNRIHINLPYLASKADNAYDTWRHFGGIYGTKLVLAMGSLMQLNDTMEIVVEFDAFSRSSQDNAFGRCVLCFNDSHTSHVWTDGAVLPVTENGDSDYYFSCYAKTVKGTIQKVDANRYVLVGSWEVLDEKSEE